MGEKDQEIKEMDPTGKVLIVHNPSHEPFAPCRKQEGDGGESDKQGRDEGTESEPESPEPLTARCSSDILRLVSPLLRKSLDGRWIESGPDSEGICRVQLDGFDSQALQYGMPQCHNATMPQCHNCTRQPRTTFQRRITPPRNALIGSQEPCSDQDVGVL
jgi:hypothetical protein